MADRKPVKPLIEGYYWRDYAGLVPSDALPGGNDYNGQPIYIGQVFKENRLVIGKIYANDNKIHYAFGWDYRTETEYVKILCTQNPEKFRWISTDVSGVGTLTTQHPIIGGRLRDFIIYVGRVHHHSETVVGRIAINGTNINHEENGIYIAYDNKVSRYKNFDILTYN